MFSSALKSITPSNINSNYSVSQTVTSTAGPWKIYDAKKKSTGKAYSVFVFDKKSLDAHSTGLNRSSAAALKKVAEEVVERLKKEASALAKLRHPSILELVEPVEDTRGGGLQFVTEPVTASLASLLQEKDDQERAGGVGGRSSRYVTEDSDGTRRRREIEIDELEIQKGLLQISKALEFLHENAGLVHGNLTPDAILVNAKSDWKLSGLSFCGPPEGSAKPTSVQPISLSEVLHLDPRLPRFVQLNLDYTSPDFVLDNNLTASADMFSLGLLCVALYNSPHRSPLECHASLSSYKRLFQSSSTVPSASNSFLSSRPLPKDLSNHVLPRLITRRPAQRMTAKEFQQSEYFDNILISTIRFLDAFPAKTPNEKAQFLRGLIKVLPSFPKSVMEKKVLPALLEEMKDRELLSLILHNVFKIIDLLPSGRRAFGDRIRPSLKEIFVTNAKQAQDKDPARDAGLMIILEQLPVIVGNCNGKEFKDDILPIIYVSLESPTPSIVDASLRSLPTILPVMDFGTIKNELFPAIATIFSKTTSLAIKVRGLQAFVILCGGSSDPAGDDGLDGLDPAKKKKTPSTSILDKYTMQEKIVPLIKGIKTKEPAVMMAALELLKVIGRVADADFVAIDILPILWAMSLGPLLNLKQFQGFMELIKTLSGRVEEEQTRKLQELTGNGNGASALPTEDFMSFGAAPGSALDANGTSEDDFERLVKGRSTATSGNPMGASWETMASTTTVTSPVPRQDKPASTPAFSWSTPSPTSSMSTGQLGAVKAREPSFRTVTPDLNSFGTLTPTSTQFSQPLRPIQSTQPMQPLQPTLNSQPSMSSPPSLHSNPSAASINWAVASAATPNAWASPSTTATSSFPMPSTAAQIPSSSAFASLSLDSRPPLGQSRVSSFSLAPPPGGTPSSPSGFSLPPPPGAGMQAQQSSGGTGTQFGGVGGMGTGMGTGMGMGSGMGSGMMAANRTSMGMTSPMGGAGTNTASMNGMGGMSSMNGMNGMNGIGMAQKQTMQQPAQQPQKSGLDKYESLL